MLKEKRHLIEILFLITDLIIVTLAWFLAYFLRFSTTWIPVEKGVPELDDYFSLLFIIWPVWAIMFRYVGLYQPMRGTSRMRELWLLINSNILSVLVFMAFIYLFREKSVEYSRLVFVYFAGLAIVGTVLERGILRTFLREVRRRGYNLRYILLVGAGQVAADVAKRVRKHRELGIQMIGCLSSTKDDKVGPDGLPVLGGYDDLSHILNTLEIDQVLIGLPLEDSDKLPSILTQASDSIVDVKVIPDLYRFVSLGGYIQEFEGLPAISLQESPMNLTAKRFVDFVLAFILTIIFSPLMLIVALLVKLTSKGGILYSQERVSYDGFPFKIYKFRTMHVNAEQEGPGWTKENDNRITPIGAFLRSTSLDELPQLFNVLVGHMSIVGPRPERPVYIKEFRKRIPRYMLRHKVPAGMTGWAQVNGWRGDTSIDKRIEYDLYYIENWSLFFDLKILILTVWKGFRNSNAY